MERIRDMFNLKQDISIIQLPMSEGQRGRWEGKTVRARGWGGDGGTEVEESLPDRIQPLHSCIQCLPIVKTCEIGPITIASRARKGPMSPHSFLRE